MRSIPEGARLSVAVLLTGLALAACETTEQTTDARPSGFLGDYSKLVKGKDGEAQLIYLAPDAKFQAYDSILIDPVTFWVKPDTAAADLDAEKSQHLTDRFFTSVHTRLAKEYKIVAAPGPKVMRARFAITEAKGSMVVLNTITTTIPTTRLLSQLIDLDKDTAILIGEAAIEVEVLDSMSGERLAAAVDERMGNKTMRTMFFKWGDVEDALDYWAIKFGDRLAKLRKGDRTPLES